MPAEYSRVGLEPPVVVQATDQVRRDSLTGDRVRSTVPAARATTHVVVHYVLVKITATERREKLAAVNKNQKYV